MPPNIFNEENTRTSQLFIDKYVNICYLIILKIQIIEFLYSILLIVEQLECTRKPLRGDIDTHNPAPHLEESVDHVYHTSQPLDPSIQ